uniref:CARD domain-containing protein n=1 Tax=Denticeps clupeoides TaxID=299321 RepID=A0AAY4BQ85_9TELE
KNDGPEKKKSDDDECWAQLEDYRLLLIKNIEPSRITPYLRQCKVLNGEDEEQIFNDPNVFIRRQKVGVLLDILQRTGHKGYVAFLESLELDYPQLYLKITGKEPARAFSILVGEFYILYQQLSAGGARRWTTRRASSRCANHELRKQRERVLRMREERDRLWEKARALKEENYGLLHELTRLSEEKNGAFMSNRDLQLEIEKLKHCLMNAESDSKIHRKPSQDMVWSLQRENDLLTSRIQELENSIQHDRVSIQELEDYKQHAQAKHQELVNNLYALRRNLQEAEQLRDKARKDHLPDTQEGLKMYRARMEEILKQMDEVIRERDKAIATREEYHQENSRNLQDKDKYRKQIRELGEKCDELQVQLFRTEGEVLALQTKLKNCAHQVCRIYYA